MVDAFIASQHFQNLPVQQVDHTPRHHLSLQLLLVVGPILRQL